MLLSPHEGSHCCIWEGRRTAVPNFPRHATVSPTSRSNVCQTRNRPCAHQRLEATLHPPFAPVARPIPSPKHIFCQTNPTSPNVFGLFEKLNPKTNPTPNTNPFKKVKTEKTNPIQTHAQASRKNQQPVKTNKLPMPSQFASMARDWLCHSTTFNRQ